MHKALLRVVYVFSKLSANAGREVDVLLHSAVTIQPIESSESKQGRSCRISLAASYKLLAPLPVDRLKMMQTSDFCFSDICFTSNLQKCGDARRVSSQHGCVGEV